MTLSMHWWEYRNRYQSSRVYFLPLWTISFIGLWKPLALIYRSPTNAWNDHCRARVRVRLLNNDRRPRARLLNNDRWPRARLLNNDRGPRARLLNNNWRLRLSNNDDLRSA
jgi:hypothetical protein